MELRPIRLLAFLLPMSVAAGGDADTAVAEASNVESSPRSAEDIKKFQETLDRYGVRMTEFQAEARSIVDRQEAEERAQLDDGYGALITELNEQDLALREMAMKRFETFLDKYPRSVHSPHVMFRLAELYFEEAEEDWFAADKEFQLAMESLGDGNLDDIPEEPAKNYRKSVTLYKRIIADYPDYEYLDGTYYMLGFCSSEPASAQYDEEQGLAYFQALVDQFPKSEFAAAAHLRVGEYHFDYNDLDKATFHYQQVVDLEGREGSLYDEGLYKLAWSKYKQSDYDEALSLLTELLDWSEQVNMARTGKESPMAPEAIEYTAISFSDVADLEGGNPINVAQAFYGRIGNREFEPKVYRRLADVLKQQARFDEAIEAYTYLQDTWPEDPNNPDYQWTIAQLHMSKVPPAADSAQDAIAQLTERYNDESAWFRANRANPDALSKARGYIEQSLAAVAVSNHAKAIDSGAPEDFAKAADYYREYLTKFPFASDYYEIEWYLADTLLKAGKLDEAASEYEQLLKGGDHNYAQGAMWLLMQVRRQRILDKYGAFDKLPNGAVVEKQVDTLSGGKRDVYTIGEEHKAFIEICDQLVAADFRAAAADVEQQLAAAKDAKDKERLKSELESIQAFAEALDQFRPALAYLPAQILFYHGHFDDARPRFFSIIEQFPRNDEAAFSASLVLDSYTVDDDLENLRKYAGIYKNKRLGSNPDAVASDSDFGSREEAAAFKLAEQYIAKGEREKAAEAFLEFIDDFPKSEIRNKALYNAANSYEILGRVERSIQLFERYINEYPEDSLSRPLFFRIATNYATALELEKAVTYYQQLYDTTKGRGIDFADAPDALYNAGFLRIGLGQYPEAARTFEQYAQENPDRPDAEKVMFQAGDLWERVGPSEAMAFYKRYLRVHPDTEPDHVMEAYNRIATLVEEGGARERQVDAAWEDLSDAYTRLAASSEIGQRGRHYAAHAEFRKLWRDYEAFQEIKFTSNDDKNAKLLLEDKKNQLTDIEGKASSLITTYQDFDYSAAALYVNGAAYLKYADMLFEAPPPKGLDDDELMLYQEAIDELRLPVEDKGRARLEANLKKASDEKLWSEWLTTTQVMLNERYPAEFTVDKSEVRGAGDSYSVPMAGPISLRGAEASAEEGPSETETPPAEQPAPEPDEASPWGGGQ